MINPAYNNIFAQSVNPIISNVLSPFNVAQLDKALKPVSETLSKSLSFSNTEQMQNLVKSLSVINPLLQAVQQTHEIINASYNPAIIDSVQGLLNRLYSSILPS